jgi:hypothetical protein
MENKMNTLTDWVRRNFTLPAILAMISTIIVSGVYVRVQGESIRQLQLNQSALGDSIQAIQTESRGLDTRVVKLEGFAGQGGRFTEDMAAKMKLELQNEWLQEIAAIRRQIDTLPQTLQIPPVWWEQYVKTEFTRLEGRIEAHERNMP